MCGEGRQGTIEQAVAQIEAFRGLLEHRVIARFDAAVAAGDLGGMAECARIMAEFRQGESQLVQVLPLSRALVSLRATAALSPQSLDWERTCGGHLASGIDLLVGRQFCSQGSTEKHGCWWLL